MITTTSFGALYAAGKLKSDCSDLRFTNSNGDILTFFTEVCDATGGTSVIWVQVDTLASPSTTIHMYYGNPSATSTGPGASLSWSGSVIVMMKASSLPTGWSNLNSIIGYFPYGSTTSGTTGGTATHSHTITSATVATSAATFAAYVGLASPQATAAHTHASTLSASSVTAWPPYMDYAFMYPSTTSYNLPANSVIMMNGAIPSGWIQTTELTGRFPRGGTYTGIGGGSATHTHTITGSLLAASGPTTTSDGVDGCTAVASSTHTHTVSFTSNDASSVPPWFSVVYIQNSALQPLQPNMVLMFQGSLPPLGWTRVTGLDGRYPQGSSTFGQTGSGTHTHTFTGASGQVIGTVCSYHWTVNNYYPSTSTHTHTVSGTTDSATNQPPYYSVIFGQRQASLPTVALGTEQHYPTAQYLLITGVNPSSEGTVSISTSWYDSGTSITTLSATASSGYIFSSWSDGTTALPHASFTMNQPMTLIANFVSSSIQVTVTSYPATGSGFLTVDGIVYDTSHAFSWTAGSLHTLVASSPVSCPGITGCQYVFVQWSNGATAMTYSYTTPSTGPAAVTAIYKTQYQVTIGVTSMSAPILTLPTPLLLPPSKTTTEEEAPHHTFRCLCNVKS